VTYSPTVIENNVAAAERIATDQGLRFVRVDPRITRNDRNQTLDVEFAIVQGERLFVERIDIQGNTTTLDRVVRRQIRSVEGDPFNPREIREAAERIRALGISPSVDVDARQGSAREDFAGDLRGDISLFYRPSTSRGTADRLAQLRGQLWLVILREPRRGLTSSLGYTYSYDTRGSELNPTFGMLLRFNQDFAGLGGDRRYIKTTALASAERLVMNEDVTLRAELEGGAINMLSGNSRVTERFFLSDRMRGFRPAGIGPRDLTADNEDALGGNFFAVARFESEFPLGLPEEYGVSGGAFFDVGSVWGLSDTAGTGGPVDDSLNWRAAAGVSLFWDTPIGPLRFNFSYPVRRMSYDRPQNFDLTVSTRF
jgi:outer membrane protein assembly factor BamA